MNRFGSKLYMSEETGYTLFLCPACKDPHAVSVAKPHGWGWNGSGDAPTFTPSVGVNLCRSNPVSPVCHSFVTDGRIQFLSDCTHDMAGQTVDLPDWNTKWGGE